MAEPPVRIILAKIGLDGHDRGVKVVARGLRDAGFHVIYSGLWQSIEAVVRTAADEDADLLGVSLLNGTHLSVTPRLIKALNDEGLSHIGVFLGGIIPDADIPKLTQLGVERVFGPGASIPEIVEHLKQTNERRKAARPPANVSELFERFQQQDRSALTRLLSMALDPKTEGQVRDAFFAIQHARPATPVIAFTGSGGVGKSTLLGRMIDYLRNQEKRVAVLACDPQSPISGGAILGDRVRMNSRPQDLGVYIRSVATSSGQQALAKNIDVLTGLLANFGFDVVLLETVGAGQGDTAVRQAAQAVVLLMQPESGDEVQWEKAGVMEIADVLVVNKGDLPGADRAASQLRMAVNIPGFPAKPVLIASGGRNEGIAELWQAIEGVVNKERARQ